jgi:mannose-6-phosphate isomerase-like protein (cupin superfamily)
MTPIKIDEKFSLFSEHWRPKTIARLNGQELKLIKVQGVFPWHKHDTEDELFLVWRGTFRVEFRDHIVTLAPGELVVVPAGFRAPHGSRRRSRDPLLRARRSAQYGRR